MMLRALYKSAGHKKALIYILPTPLFRFLTLCPERFTMQIKQFPRYSLLVCWLTIICLIPPVFAAGTKEQQVKVTFIYNFAKFIKWPTSADADASFIICVVGEQPLSGSISLLQGRYINGRAIDIRPIAKPEPGDCHIVFIGDTEAQYLPGILQDIATLPVLSISDLPNFVHGGGIIGMKIIDSRIHFDINLTAAHKAGLDINSQLLKLATEILQ